MVMAEPTCYSTGRLLATAFTLLRQVLVFCLTCKSEDQELGGLAKETTNTMETINKNLVRSRLFWGLKEKYVMKKIAPFVGIGIVIWVAWIWQLTNAYPILVTPNIIVLN